ncbi:MAG: hypothetical protein RLZZ326_1291 [Planctomycetota bacterium]|jgi:hypothetical protein
MMQGTVITDLPSISAGGAWGRSQAPVAVYQAPAVERVVPGTQGSRVGFRRSYSPGAAGRVVLAEHPGMGRSAPEIRLGFASQAAHRSLANETVAVSVPRRIALPGGRPRQVSNDGPPPSPVSFEHPVGKPFHLPHDHLLD